MTLPSPRSDPGGLAALAVALIAAVFAALDPSGVLGDRWAPVVAAGLALVAVLAARSRAYAPASVAADVDEAVSADRRSGGRTTVLEIGVEALAALHEDARPEDARRPPPRPKPKPRPSTPNVQSRRFGRGRGDGQRRPLVAEPPDDGPVT